MKQESWNKWPGFLESDPPPIETLWRRGWLYSIWIHLNTIQDAKNEQYMYLLLKPMTNLTITQWFFLQNIKQLTTITQWLFLVIPTHWHYSIINQRFFYLIPNYWRPMIFLPIPNHCYVNSINLSPYQWNHVFTIKWSVKSISL